MCGCQSNVSISNDREPDNSEPGWIECIAPDDPPGCTAEPIPVPNPGFLRRGYCDPFDAADPQNRTCEGTDDPCTSDADCDQAALFIIFVSDEDDESFGPVDYYWRLLEGHKGKGNAATASSPRSAMTSPACSAGRDDCNPLTGRCANTGWPCHTDADCAVSCVQVSLGDTTAGICLTDVRVCGNESGYLCSNLDGDAACLDFNQVELD